MTYPIDLLIVENSVADAGMILRELEAAAFSVTARRVETESQLREELTSSDVDVILADYTLPDLEGPTVLEIARELVPETPVIFVAGLIGEEGVAEALRTGATDYVLKDHLSGLGTSVHRAVDRRKLHDRRRAEQHTQQLNAERFEYAAKATSDALWDWDIIRDTVWEADEGGAAGSPHDQIGVARWFGRVHPGDREAVEASLRAAVARGEERWNAEYRFRLGATTFVPVFSRAYVIRDRNGKPVRVVGALQNKLEQRREEEAGRLSELRCLSLAESAADGILLTTEDCTIIYANQHAGSIFGVSAETMVGRNFEAFLPPPAATEEAIQDLARAGNPVTGVRLITGLRADGSEFPIELSVATFTRDGELFFTKIVRDISHRIAAGRRREVRTGVTRLLEESRSTEETLPELLRIMSDGLGWQGAAMWVLDPVTRRLTCAALSMGEGQDAVAITCRGGSFGEGEGLPGLAFKTGCVETVTLPDNAAFPLQQAVAGAAGLRATAVPVAGGNGCLAVIEFFQWDGRETDPAVVELAADIAAQIGRYIERARAEEARIAALDRLREAQSLAHVGSWEYDIASGASTSSQETYAIFGLDPAVALSFDTCMSLAHPDDREHVRQSLTSQFTTGTPELLHFTHRIVRNGEERVLDVRSCARRDDDGVLRRASGTVQDVTEQALAAQTIERLGRRSDLVLECAAEGIVGIGKNNETTFVNPAFLAMMGWPEEELAACGDLHGLLHHTKPGGTPYPSEECPLHLTVADGQKRSVRGEYFFRPDGPFFVDYECAPIIENGEIAGAVMTCRDVTESHRLARQLDLAKRVGTLGRIAATIAHEFNNVLMGIEPFAEIIRRRVKNDEKVAKAANQISSSVRRGRRVTDEILRFTRPVELALHNVDLKAWLLQLEPELRALAGPNARILLTLPAGPAFTACDPAQLQQVIANLVLNARDAMPGEGTISIALRLPAGAHAAELSVRDSGEGIPPDEVFNIFEPLFTTKRGGTGLGLAVARQIVMQHGGAIEAFNPDGGGAEFRITIPIGTAAPSTFTPVEAPIPSDVRKLLLVEDEPAVSDGLSMLLDAEGFSVQCVGLGAAVADAIAASMPDCVILDLTLPDMDGMDVFRILRKLWPRLPVVFSTGHGGETELAEALESGHAGLLQKPYEIDALIAAVHQAAAA